MSDTHTLTLTPTDRVQSWWDEPTVKLRWKNGTLEQMHWRRGMNAFGQEIKRDEEWLAVPTAA